MPLVEQELLTLPEHLSAHPVFSGVHFAQSLVFSAMFCRLLFVLSFFFLAIVLSITATSLINKKSLKIPKGGNQNPYIEEEQKTQCQKKKYKRTNNGLGNDEKKYTNCFTSSEIHSRHRSFHNKLYDNVF